MELKMKLEGKTNKSKSVSSKITEKQNSKLETLAKSRGITKSNLISQLLNIGYENITKKAL